MKLRKDSWNSRHIKVNTHLDTPTHSTQYHDTTTAKIYTSKLHVYVDCVQWHQTTYTKRLSILPYPNPHQSQTICLVVVFDINFQHFILLPPSSSLHQYIKWEWQWNNEWKEKFMKITTSRILIFGSETCNTTCGRMVSSTQTTPLLSISHWVKCTK